MGYIKILVFFCILLFGVAFAFLFVSTQKESFKGMYNFLRFYEKESVLSVLKKLQNNSEVEGIGEKYNFFKIFKSIIDDNYIVIGNEVKPSFYDRHKFSRIIH